MKKIVLLLIITSILGHLFSQDTIHQTISEQIIAKEKKGIDTIATDDKFLKIILYDDFSWDYLNLGRPTISEEMLDESWDEEVLHAYKEVTIASLPEEIDLLLTDSVNGYCAPIIGRVYSKYSFRGSREHRGCDIPLTIGDTIRAAFDGKVRISETSKNTGGYGNLIIIRHTNGLETYYGHLSKILVSPGELVKAGEVIGCGGNTGRSTGPHLHFETRYMGKAFDPERIINFSTGELRDTLFTLKKHYFSIYSHYGQTDAASIAASNRKIHIIRSGDTLGALASKYKTTVDKICKLNGISRNTVLRIGRRLIVR